MLFIDPQDPSKVELSDEAYGKRAIGVYSGANGLKPGIGLSQLGMMEGDIPIAIAGQVFVKTVGRIEVGDMLTSSSKPGHAMRVKSWKKARGAIVGKALSIADAEGLVLMLVSLQ